MGESRKIMQVRSNRQVPVRVLLLDDELYEDFVDKRAVGFILFDKVCERLNLLEKDYFGLTYRDPAGIKFWLNNEKKISKQLKGMNWEFTFEVKFYSPDPAQLAEDITRYQLCLQIRRDIVNEKLPCSFLTYTLLGSYTAQSELGDYDTEEFGSGYKYLKDMKFAPHQDKELLQKIAELHRQHKGQTPEEAELHFLENSVRLSMYGVELHAAKDAEGSDISLGVCAQGLIVYKDNQQMNRFVWPKVLKISYRRNKYFIKIRPGEFEEFASLIGFKLANVKMAKRLWKISVEHHSFFRFREAEMPKQTGLIPRFGSRFRYSGRTMFQTRQVAAMENRDGVSFDRVMSKRGTFAGRTQNMRKRDEDRHLRREEVRKQPISPDSKPAPVSDRPQEDRKPSPPEPSYPPPELKHAPPVAPKPSKPKPKPSPREPSSENASLDRSFDSFEDVPDRRSKMERMHAVATPLAAIMQKSIDKEAEHDRYREEEDDRYRHQVGKTEPVKGRRFRESTKNNNTQGAQRNIPSHDITRSRDAYSYQSSSVDSMLSADFDDYDGETGLIENRAMSVDALHIGSGHKSSNLDFSSSQSSDDISSSSYQSYHAKPYKSSDGLYAEIDEVKKEIHKQYGRKGKAKEMHRDSAENTHGPLSENLRQRHRSDTIEQTPGPSREHSRQKHRSGGTFEPSPGPSGEQSRVKHRSDDTIEQTPEPSNKKSKSWFSLKQKFFSKNKDSKSRKLQDKPSKTTQSLESKDSKHQQSLQAPMKRVQLSRSTDSNISQSHEPKLKTGQVSKSRNSKTPQSQETTRKTDQTDSSSKVLGQKSHREKMKHLNTDKPTSMDLSKQTPTYAQINKTQNENKQTKSMGDHQFDTDMKKQNQSVTDDKVDLDESNTGSLREELKMYILGPDKRNSSEIKTENTKERDTKQVDVKKYSYKKHKNRQSVEDISNTATNRSNLDQTESQDLNKFDQEWVSRPSSSLDISGVQNEQSMRSHKRNSMEQMEPLYKEIPDKVSVEQDMLTPHDDRTDMLTPHDDHTDTQHYQQSSSPVTLEKSFADSALTTSQVSLSDDSVHAIDDTSGEKMVTGRKDDNIESQNLNTDSLSGNCLMKTADDRFGENEDVFNRADQVKSFKTTTAIDNQQHSNIFENHTYENLPIRKPFTLSADNQISSYDSSQDLIHQVDKQFDANILKKLDTDQEESDPIDLFNVSSDSACNFSLDGDKSDISLHVTQHPSENIGSGSSSSLYQIAFDGSSVGSPEDSHNVSYSNSFVPPGIGDLSRNDNLIVNDHDLEKFSTVSSGSSDIEAMRPSSKPSKVGTFENNSEKISLDHTKDNGKEPSKDLIEPNEQMSKKITDKNKVDSAKTQNSQVFKDDIDASKTYPNNQRPKKSVETTFETTFSDAPSLIETNITSEISNKMLGSMKSMEEDSTQRWKERRMLVKERAFQVEDYNDEPFRKRMPARAFTEDSHKSKPQADNNDSFKSPMAINNAQASLPTSKTPITNEISKSLTEYKEVLSQKQKLVLQEKIESPDKADSSKVHDNKPIDQRSIETSSDKQSQDTNSQCVKAKSKLPEATAAKSVSAYMQSSPESKPDSHDIPKPPSKDPYWYKTHLLPSKQSSQKDISNHVATKNDTNLEDDTSKLKMKDENKPLMKASKAAAAVAAAYSTTDRSNKPQRHQDTDTSNADKPQEEKMQNYDTRKHSTAKEAKPFSLSKPHAKQASDEASQKHPYILKKPDILNKPLTKQPMEKLDTGKLQEQQDSDRYSSERPSQNYNKCESDVNSNNTSKTTSRAPQTVHTQYNQSLYSANTNLSKPLVPVIRDSKVYTQSRPTEDDRTKHRQQLPSDQDKYSPKDTDEGYKILSGNLKTHSKSMEQPSAREEKRRDNNKSISNNVSLDSNSSASDSAVAKNRKPSSSRKQKISPGVIHMMNPCPSGWMEGGLEEKPRPRSWARDTKQHMDSENQLFADQIKIDKDSQISSLDMDPNLDTTTSSVTESSLEPDLSSKVDNNSSTVDKTDTNNEDILTTAPQVELLCRRVWTHTKKPKTVGERKHDNNDKEFTDAICMGPDETNFNYVYKGPSSSSSKHTTSGQSNQNNKKSAENVESSDIISGIEGNNAEKEIILDDAVNISDIAGSLHGQIQLSSPNADILDATLKNEKTISSQETTPDYADCRHLAQVTASKSVDHESMNINASLTSQPNKQEKTINLLPRQDEGNRNIEECEDSTDEEDESSGSSGTHTDSDSSQEIELASFEMPQQQTHLTTIASMSNSSYSDNAADGKVKAWDQRDSKVNMNQDYKEPGNEVYAIDCSFEDVETYKIVKKKDEATDDVKNPILCECNFNTNVGESYQPESNPCDTDLDYDFVSRYGRDFQDQCFDKVPEVIDETPYKPLRSNLKCKFKSEPCLFDRRVHFQDNLPIYKSSESIRSKPYSGITPEDSEASKLEYMQKFIQCLFEKEPKSSASSKKDRFLEPLPSFDDDSTEYSSSNPQNLSTGSIITAMDIFKHTPDVHATEDSSGEVLVSHNSKPSFAVMLERAHGQTAVTSNTEYTVPSSSVSSQWSLSNNRLEPTSSIDSTDSEPPPRPSLPIKYQPRIVKPVTGRAHKQEEEPNSSHADLVTDIDDITMAGSLQVYTKPEETLSRSTPSPEIKESLNQISTALSRISDENEQWQPIITRASITCEAELIPEAARSSTYTTAHDVWDRAVLYGMPMNQSRDADVIYWMNRGVKAVEQSKRLSKSETDLEKSTRAYGSGQDGRLMRYTYTYNDDSEPDSPKIKSVTYEYVTEYKLNNVKVNYKQNRKVQTDVEPKRKGKTDSVEKFMIPRPKKMSDAKVQTSLDKPDSKAIPVEEIIERSVCYPLGPINNLSVTNSQEPLSTVEEGTVRKVSHKVYSEHDKKESKSLFKAKQEGPTNKRPSHSTSWVNANSLSEAKSQAMEKDVHRKSQQQLSRPYEHGLGKGYANKKVIELNSEKFVLQSFEVDPADAKQKAGTQAAFPSNTDKEMKRNWTLLDEVDGDCEFEEYKAKKKLQESAAVESVPDSADSHTDKPDGGGKNLYSALMAEELPDVQVEDCTNESIFIIQAMAVIALGTVLVFLLPYAT